MAASSDLHLNGSVIRYDPDILATPEPRMFDVDWLRQNGCLIGSSRGRSEAHFVELGGRQMVLRHFRRGGLVGRINPDLYLRRRSGQSRGMREFDFLQWMHARSLPVPRAVAARFVPWAMWYQADLVTERILGARPLEDVLRSTALSAGVWQVVGATIRRFHDHGVYHADLNARNILLDDAGRVWLIDFDKGENRAPGAWTARNLARLQRSLHKEDAKDSGLNWTDGDWSELLSGYGRGMGAQS